MFDDDRWGDDPLWGDHSSGSWRWCPREPERDRVEDLAGARRGSAWNVFLYQVDLPRGLEREHVQLEDRDYTLSRHSESRTLAAVGAFRTIPIHDLKVRDLDARYSSDDQRDESTDHRSGEISPTRAFAAAPIQATGHGPQMGARLARIRWLSGFWPRDTWRRTGKLIACSANRPRQPRLAPTGRDVEMRPVRRAALGRVAGHTA